MIPLAEFPLTPKQVESIVGSTNTRISAWIGAVRSGKTIGSLWAFLMAIAAAPDTGLVVCVGRTLQTIERNLIEPLQDPEIFREFAGHVEHTRGSSTAMILGRTVHLIGAADARAEGKLRGLTACLALVDEATLLPEDFFTQLLARLSVPGARMLLTSNPDGPGHWLRKKFLLRADELGIAHWHFTLEDNRRFLPDGFIADLKRELTGVFYKRMVLGMWVAGEGAIFDMFDESRHVIDELPPIARYLGVGIDFGMNHPTHAVMLCLATDGRLVITSEYRYDAKLQHGQQLTVAQVSAELKRWVGPRRPEWVCVDPSAEVLEVQLYYDGWQDLMHADNAVLDGIRQVASLFATDQLVVHSSCVGLIEELPSYAWDDKAAERGDEKPIKAGDDACLVAGTLVATAEGDCPIEQVRLGDLVFTRDGLRPVTAAGMTSESATVYAVALSNGETLTGTGNHPVWVSGRGWTNLDALRYGDRMMSWPEAKSLFSTVSNSAAIPTLRTERTGTISRLASRISRTAYRTCTRRSGKPPTDLSRQATTSTTTTATTSTTTSPTWSASTPSSTSATMPRSAWLLACTRLRSGWRTWRGSARSLWPGMARLRVWPGTGPTPRLAGLARASHATRSASGAAEAMSPRDRAVATGSARTTARALGAGQRDSMTSTGSVCCAVLHSGSIGTARLNPAPDRVAASIWRATASESISGVEHVSNAGWRSPSSARTRQPDSAPVHVCSVEKLRSEQSVWNLTVAGAPEFFAQDVLVHNCDALRYVVRTTASTWQGQIRNPLMVEGGSRGLRAA